MYSLSLALFTLSLRIPSPRGAGISLFELVKKSMPWPGFIDARGYRKALLARVRLFRNWCQQTLYVLRYFTSYWRTVTLAQNIPWKWTSHLEKLFDSTFNALEELQELQELGKCLEVTYGPQNFFLGRSRLGAKKLLGSEFSCMCGLRYRAQSSW